MTRSSGHPRTNIARESGLSPLINISIAVTTKLAPTLSVLIGTIIETNRFEAVVNSDWLWVIVKCSDWLINWNLFSNTADILTHFCETQLIMTCSNRMIMHCTSKYVLPKFVNQTIPNFIQNVTQI